MISSKSLMLGVVSLIFSIILGLTLLLMFSSVTSKVQETVTQVTERVVVEEMDVLLSGNYSADNLVNMQETLMELQDRMSDIFK